MNGKKLKKKQMLIVKIYIFFKLQFHFTYFPIFIEMVSSLIYWVENLRKMVYIIFIGNCLMIKIKQGARIIFSISCYFFIIQEHIEHTQHAGMFTYKQ